MGDAELADDLGEGTGWRTAWHEVECIGTPRPLGTSTPAGVLRLYMPDDDGDVNPDAPPEASSTCTTGTEVIEYTSADGGTYYLHAFTFPEGGERAGSYELVVE